MRKLLMSTLTLLCLGIFLFCCYKLYSEYSRPQSNAELMPDIQEVIESNTESTQPTDPTNNETIETTPPKVITQGMQAVYAWQTVNNKVVGVISIQDLENEPIVQTKEQNEYLYLDIQGNYNKNGTLFASQDSILGVTNTTCIFGHAMKTGAMFGRLKEYKNLDYLKANPVFTVSSESDTYYCKIVGVMLPSGDYWKNNWYYANPILSEEEFEEFRFQVRSRSLFVINDEFDYNSKYIMLSTCAYESTNERLVVVAKIVDDPNVNTSLWSTNPLVLRSVEYYAETGRKTPSLEALQSNYEANYG